MKTKFLSRIGMWNTSPCIRKCLTSLKALTLLLVMLMSVNVWGAVTWTRVATVKELTDGGTFIMGYEAEAKSGVIVPLRSADCNAKTTANGYFNTGTTAGSSTNGTIDMSKVTVTADYEVYITSPASGKINIQMVNGEGSFYGATSGGSTKNTGRLYTAGNSAETNLTPEFSSETNNQFKLTSDVTGQYKYLKYNTGSPRFAYYNSAGSNIVFYKKDSGDDPDPTEPSLSVSPTTIDFGTVYQNATVDAEDVTVTFANLTANDVEAAITGSVFSINKTGSFTSGDEITITPSTATLGEYEETLTLSATTDELEETVTITMNVVEAPVLVTYNKVTDIDDLAEGDIIVLASSTTAYGVAPTDNHAYIDAKKFAESSATLTDNVLKAADAYELTLAKSGDNWTMTSADGLVGTTAAKTMTFGSSDSKNVTTWSISFDASANASITSTGSYGTIYYNTGSPRFLNYTSSQAAIQIYKKEVPAVYSAITVDDNIENGSVSVTGAADLTSVASGTTITLGNTPADGYKLDDYDVYKTGESSTKVTVKDGKFKMPAYAVTVSATFSLSIETPVLSEAAGDKDDAINVKVSNYNSNYSYYYTLDGNDPTNASTPYVDADGIAINASCTLKVIAYSGDVTSPVASAAYNLPLMTMDAIFAAATAAGKTATNARVKFTDCVVTGVKNANAYLTDNAGKGLIIYASSHGFEVNDKLNGAVNVKVQLYNGSAELTELTSSTSGLTVTKDGSVSPITTMGIASLSGVNTGAVLSYTNLIYDNGHFSDGTNTIQPYNNFSIENYPTFENGDKYNVTGVYLQYSSTKEIMPRSLDDLEKIEATKYAINLATVEHGTIATDPETEAADGVKVTLSATPAAGYMLGEWSVVDAESNPVEVTANQFTMPAMAVTVSATFVELPIWATTYTSNVTVGTDKVKLAEAYQPADYPTDGYDAKKDGTNSKAASIAIKVPANTTGLHYHLFAWNGEGGKTVTIKKGEETLKTFKNVADASISGNSPYTLENNPADAYGYVALEGITEETTITFSTTSGNQRIVLFGVNAIQPAAITIDPASKDFGEVKQGFNAEQVFTLAPNAFATGTITAEIDGDNVFTASTIADNKVTVTFAPTEIKDDYSATLVIKHDGTQMCTATLTGKGIAATTPEIAVSTDEIDFGKVKQDATVAAQTVTVTLNYLDAATASIDDDTYFSIDKTNLGAGANTITISATASSTGEKSATITITGIGATTKTITVKMDVTSKWAGEYTSNVEVGSDKVIISEEEYEAIKKGTGSKSESATITVPKGTQTLHFHAAAWNNENTVLVVKQGDTELGSFNLYKDAGVKSNSPFTLAGNNYDTDQYFYVNVSAYTATDAAEITFTTTASPYRFVLYGVNQEGGIVPELDHLTITGSATHTEYEVDETFDPAGLTVSAIYTLEDVEQDPIDVTEDVEWEFTPATLTAGSYDVTVKATYEDKEVSTTVAVTVTAATPEITVYATEVGFGTVPQNAEVDAKTVAVTLKAITEATVEVSGEGASAFNVTPASLTESGNITITPVTTAAGEFTATITISADGADSKTITVTMTVTDGNLPKEKVDFTEVYSSLSGNETADFTGYEGVTFSIVAAKGEGTNAPKYYANGSAVRAYKDNKITISSEKTIAFILINHTGKSYQDVEATVDNGTLKVNEAYSMWTLGATSGTITLAATVRFDNITVYYEYDEVVRSAQSENQIGTGCQTLDIVAVKGATLYQVNYTDGCYLNFMEVTYPVKAGMPIIMQADNTNDGKIEVIYGEKNEEAVAGLNKDGLYGYIGTTQFDIPNDEGCYVFKGGMLRPALDNYTTSGHAYVKLSEVPTEDQLAESPAPRRRMSMGIERNTPTSMEEIFNAASQDGKFIINGQLFIFRDGKVFNAQGSLIK